MLSLPDALAHLVAATFDLAHEDASPADQRCLLLADRLAQAVCLDMAAVGTADPDCWARLPKASLLAASHRRGRFSSAEGSLKRALSRNPRLFPECACQSLT
jgi:hypothetical protein